MSTSFPTSLDDFTNPSGSQSLASGGHSQLHSDLNDAVEAIQAKVGVDASAVVTSHDYLLAQLAGNLLLGAGEVSVTDAVEATIGRMHVCSGTAADYTVTLPAAAGNANKLIGFRMSPLLTRFVTLVGYDEPGTGTGSIDHASSRVLWANESAILFCDGADWFKVAGKTIPLTAIAAPSGTTAVNALTNTRIVLNTSVSDPSTRMVDTSGGSIGVKRSGTYKATAQVRYNNTASAAPRLTGGMWRTRSAVTTEWIILGETVGTASGGYTIVQTNVLVPMLAADTYDLYAWHNAGAGLTAGGAGNTAECFLGLEEVVAW